MSLTVAVQMDPLETIGIAGDSTFALMLKAQERGHKLYHYLADALTYQDGRLYAGAHEVSVQSVPGDHFRLGPFAILGDIRHMTQISEGGVRLGIEFTKLSTRDVMLLNVVARSHSFA